MNCTNHTKLVIINTQEDVYIQRQHNHEPVEVECWWGNH